MVETIAMDKTIARPFENWTSRHQIFKKCGFQMFLDFNCRISDSHFPEIQIWILEKFVSCILSEKAFENQTFCLVFKWHLTIESRGRFLVRFSLSEVHRDRSIQLRCSPMPNFFATNSCEKVGRTANRSIEKSTLGLES